MDNSSPSSPRLTRRCATARWTRSAAPRRSPNCWPSARSWTLSAAPATTSTSACGRCSSSTPSTAFTCPLQARRAEPRAASRSTATHTCCSAASRRPSTSSCRRRRRRARATPISSALAAAYHRLGFQTLADQVRRSVRSVRGNQWMFRMGHPADHPLRIRPELLRPRPADGTYPDPARSARRCAWT